MRIFYFLFLLFSCINIGNLAAQCSVDAGQDTSLCFGAAITLNSTTTGNGAITYSWSPSTGLSCDNCASPVANPTVTTTYTLTITDGDGCTSSDAVNVVVYPLPDATFNFGPNNVCATTPINFNATTNLAGYTYTWNFGNPASGGNNTATGASVTHTFVSYGATSETFVVTLTVTSPTGCVQSSIQNITINSLPNTTLLDPIASFKNCDGTNFNLQVFDGTPIAGTNYQIIWGDGTADYNSPTAPSGVTHTYTTADIFDLYYIVTGTNGCTDTSYQIVSNITNPAIGAANPGATTGCGPLTLCFPLSSYSANHPSTIYIVDYGDGSPVDTFTHALLPTQICHTYTQSSCGQAGNAFTFEIRAINQCDISIATVNPIRIYTGAQPEFSNPPRACVNTAVSFTNNTIEGFNTTCQTSTMYTWNFGDGTPNYITAVKNNPSHVYTTPGTYTVNLTTQNSCGANSIAHTICIEAAPNPIYDISPDTACVPFVASITNNSDTSDICQFTRSWQMINYSTSCPTTQSWGFANGTNSTSWEPDFAFNTAGAYTIRLTMVNSCGVFYNDTVVIAQDVPQINLPTVGPICQSESVSPTLTVNDCYAPVTTYNWNMPSGTPSSSTNPTPGAVVYNTPGTFNINVDVTNVCGTVTATTPLVVVAPPTANAGPDVSFCTDGSASVGGSTAVAGVTYQWSPTSNITPTNQPIATVNPTNTSDTVATISYVLTASTSATCLSTDTVLVTVNPKPNLTVNSPTICMDDTTQLLVTATTAPMTFVWNAHPELSCTNCDNPSVSPVSSSNFTVVATNQYGCVDSIQSTVTVNPLPVVNAGADQTVCDQPIPFTLTGTPAGGTWSGSANVTSAGVFTPNGPEVATLVYAYTIPATGCSNTDTVIVTVQPPVTPTFNPTDSLCLNDGVVNLNTVYAPSHSGGTWSGTGVTSPNFNPLTAGVGTHTLTYTYGTGTCLVAPTVDIIVHPNPTITANNATICVNDTAALLASGAGVGGTYLWTPNTALSCDNCANPQANPTATTTYTVTGTTILGCSSTATAVVTVNPLPVVNAGADQTVCDQPIPFTLIGTPAGGTWSGSANVTSAGVFTPNGPEVATLVYAYTIPATGCSNTDTVIVTVQPPVTPTFNPTDSLCLNDGVVNLNTVYAPSHSGGTWSGTGVTSPNFNPLTAGVGTHTLTYTYGTGTCLVAPTVDIIVHPNPTITANNATICVNDTAALLASGAGVGGTYLWTPNTALSCDNCANPQANPTATTTYTVTGTTILGCSSTTTAVVTVNPLPVVNAGADQTVCDQPIPFTLTGTPAGGTWSGSANVTSAGVFTPNGPEVATLVYAYTIPATGCSNTDTVIVTVQPPVTPTFNPTDSLCLNDGVVNLNTVYAPSHSGGTWSGTGVTSPNFNPLTAGVGTHTLTYTYGTGTCLVAPTVDIIVHPNPTITANNATICVNDTAALLASGAGVGGTYLWTPNTALSCDNCANPQANPTATTTYTVTGTTILGCSSTATAVVTVNPLPVVNAGADQTVCDQPIPFTLTGTPAGGTWSGSANVTSAGVFTPNGPEVATLVYAYTIPATGCSNTDTVIVTVQPPVTPTFNPTDSLCLNDGVVNLNTVYAPSHSGGTWSGTGVTSPNFNPLTAGVGTHTLTYTYGTGTCLVVPTVDIIVHPNPTITSNNATICVNDTAALLASGAGVGGTYLWTPNTALSCDNCANPQANPTATTTYTVTGTTILGCSSTATAVVTVNPLPVVNAGADTTLCNQAIGVQFNATPIGGIWSGQDITPSGLFTPSSVGVITLTYTYTIAATGCEASDNKIVTVVNPAQANAGLDQAICAINSTVQVVGTPATGTWSGVGVDAAGNFTTATVGNFELVYTNGLGNCLTRDTMYFTVHPLPIVNAGSDVDICVSSPSITFNATPTGGVYAGTGIVNTTTGEFNPTIATVGAHTIVYTYTDANTCVNDDSLVINVRPLPVVDFDVDSIVCLNTSVPFTNNSTLIAQANWDFGDGATSNAINPTHTYIASGIYTVQLVVTSPFGCVDSISKNLEVYVPPVAAFVVTPDSLCGPLTATFTNNSTGPDVSYLWDFGNGTTSTVANPPAVVYPSGILADTTYTISLTVSNYCGQVTTQNNVIVMPQPVAVFGTNFNSYCSPWTPEFANTSYGLPDTYSWDFGNGTTSNTADALFQIPVYTTGTDTTSYTITLTVTNECGTSTAQHTITVLPNTVNSFFNTSVVEGCENLSVDFTQYTLGSTSYHWDFGDGNTSTDYSPSHTFTQAGTYNVSLMVTNGCSFDTTTVPIVIHPSPNLAFIHQPDSVCNFSPIQFINQSDVLSNYAWTFGDGATSNITNPTHTYTTPGDYTVTLTGTSLDGYCTASATEIVHINAPPTANFTLNPSSGCVPLIVQFNNQSVGAAYSYWDFGDGNTTVNTNPQHTFTTPGTYTIQLIVQGINGCSDTLAQFINVNPVPTAAFSYQPTGVICGPNIQAQFTNASTGAVGYEWSFGDGGISNLTNPNYDYLTAGTFTIQLIAINQFGCKDTAQQVITIHQTPVASFTTPSVLGCQNNDIPFTSTSQFADSLIWNFGDGNTANGTAVTHSYSEVGSYTVSIIAIGSGGCSDTMVMTTPIDIQTSPIAAFTYETSIENITNATVIFTNQSTNYTSSVWDFGNGESSTETNPIHNYYEHSDFFVMLVAINDNGCTDTVELLVKNPLQQGLFVPNAVSPSHSDYEVSHFLPKGIGLKDYHVQIYDDWGNLIWESTKLDELGRPVEGWDGTYRGEPVQQDAYVWKISATFLDESIWEGKEYPKGKIKKSGTVTVIR